MKHTVKTVFAVLFCVVCVAISVIAVGAGFSEVQYIKYEVSYQLTPQIVDVSATYLGDTYEGYTDEGNAYYEITYTLVNPSNYGISEYQIYPSYQGSSPKNDYSYVRAIDEKRLFDLYQECDYYPAGKCAKFHQIVMVEETCNRLEIKISYQDQNSFTIDL